MGSQPTLSRAPYPVTKVLFVLLLHSTVDVEQLWRFPVCSACILSLPSLDGPGVHILARFSTLDTVWSLNSQPLSSTHIDKPRSPVSLLQFPVPLFPLLQTVLETALICSCHEESFPSNLESLTYLIATLL
eukprot:c24790_g14_i3 orf=1363-1755(-)